MKQALKYGPSAIEPAAARGVVVMPKPAAFRESFFPGTWRVRLGWLAIVAVLLVGVLYAGDRRGKLAAARSASIFINSHQFVCPDWGAAPDGCHWEKAAPLP